VINSNWHPISYRFGIIAAYCSNFGHFALLSPLWGLRDKVRCSSWAHWKARSGLSISVNWTFFARCYGWGATSEYRLKIGDFVPTGAGWPKISGRRGHPPPTIVFLSKLGLKDLLCGIKSWTDLSSVLSQSTRLTDGQTDGQTERQLSHC